MWFFISAVLIQKLFIVIMQRPSPPVAQCGRISSIGQQFTYIYEVWTGMFYVQNDLLVMRDEYASY